MNNENLIPMDLAPPVLRRQVTQTFFGAQVGSRNNPIVINEEGFEEEDYPDSDEEEEHVCDDPNNCMICGNE